MSDDVCKAVAGDVEFKLSMIIQEAQKFMRHGKRGTMVPSDIDHALQALNVQVSCWTRVRMSSVT